MLGLMDLNSRKESFIVLSKIFPKDNFLLPAILFAVLGVILVLLL